MPLYLELLPKELIYIILKHLPFERFQQPISKVSDLMLRHVIHYNNDVRKGIITPFLEIGPNIALKMIFNRYSGVVRFYHKYRTNYHKSHNSYTLKTLLSESKIAKFKDIKCVYYINIEQRKEIFFNAYKYMGTIIYKNTNDKIVMQTKRRIIIGNNWFQMWNSLSREVIRNLLLNEY